MLLGLLLPGLLWATDGGGQQQSTGNARLTYFQHRLEQLRQDFGIPGMSAAIVYKGKVVYSKGFGYSQLAGHRQASPQTPYHIASITKTFAAVAVMQLVEKGRVHLTDPVSKYGIPLPATVQVQHLLSHTSNGQPGEYFYYDGYRYMLLDQVVQQASGMDLGTYLIRNVLQPLQLKNTAFADGRQYQGGGLNLADVYSKVASPYDIDNHGHAHASAYVPYFNSAVGMVSTVEDLAQYAIAIDEHKLLNTHSTQQMWNVRHSSSGERLPYGLGWFLQDYEGLRLVYHYGIWNGASSLFLHLPDQHMTLILLTNCMRLSSHFDIQGPSGIASSSFALAFLHTFAVQNAKVPPLMLDAGSGTLQKQLTEAKRTPYSKIYAFELGMNAIAYQKLGYKQKAQEWLALYQKVFARRIVAELRKMKVLAAIGNVQDNANRTVPFTLHEPTRVKILAVGEGGNNSMRDYAWITDGKQKKVWTMKAQDCKHAGGALKNKFIQVEVELPAGVYTLHYQSDNSHSWLQWNDLPPMVDIYGAVVYLPQRKK